MKHCPETIRLIKFINGMKNQIKQDLAANKPCDLRIKKLNTLLFDLKQSMTDTDGIEQAEAEINSLIQILNKQPFEEFEDSLGFFWKSQDFKSSYEANDKRLDDEIKQLYRDYFIAKRNYINESNDFHAGSVMSVVDRLIKHPRFNGKCKIFDEIYAVFRDVTSCKQFTEEGAKSAISEAHQLAKDEFWNKWAAAKVAEGITPENANMVLDLRLSAKHLLKFEPTNKFLQRCQFAELDTNLNGGKGGIKIGDLPHAKSDK